MRVGPCSTSMNSGGIKPVLLCWRPAQHHLHPGYAGKQRQVSLEQTNSKSLEPSREGLYTVATMISAVLTKELIPPNARAQWGS